MFRWSAQTTKLRCCWEWEFYCYHRNRSKRVHFCLAATHIPKTHPVWWNYALIRDSAGLGLSFVVRSPSVWSFQWGFSRLRWNPLLGSWDNLTTVSITYIWQGFHPSGSITAVIDFLVTTVTLSERTSCSAIAPQICNRFKTAPRTVLDGFLTSSLPPPRNKCLAASSSRVNLLLIVVHFSPLGDNLAVVH